MLRHVSHRFFLSTTPRTSRVFSCLSIPGTSRRMFVLKDRIQAPVSNICSNRWYNTHVSTASKSEDPSFNVPTRCCSSKSDESSSILTIADVLEQREMAKSISLDGKIENFERWESISSKKTVLDAVEVMVRNDFGALIVTDDDSKRNIVGIVTERDVLTRAPADTSDCLVESIMSTKIICLKPSTTAMDAFASMSKKKFRHFVVIHEDMKDGLDEDVVPRNAIRCVLSVKDILKAYTLHQNKQPTTDGTKASVPGTASEKAADESPEQGVEQKVETEQEQSSKSLPETAASMVATKYSKIPLILNTRMEDKITVMEAVEAMTKHSMGSVIILDEDQRVCGIFTERDYLKKIVHRRKNPSKVLVQDVCTSDVLTVNEQESLETLSEYAAHKAFRNFPIVDKDHALAGLLTIKDIVKAISLGHDASPGYWLFEYFKSRFQGDSGTPKSSVPPVPSADEETTVVDSNQEQKKDSSTSPEKPPTASSSSSSGNTTV